MNLFDYTKAWTDMWQASAKALMSAQEQAFRTMRANTAVPGSAVPAPLPSVAPLQMPQLFSLDTAEATRAAKAIADLWTAAFGLSGTIGEMLPRMQGSETTAASLFRRMIDPRTWLQGADDLDQALQRLAEGPRLADMGNLERMYAAVFQAWVVLRQRSLEHNAVVLEGWMRAGRAFTERMREASTKGEVPSSPREALNLWIDTANRTLLEMQRSEGFLESQAKLLKASTDLRYAQRQVAEFYGEMFGLPTREEIDDVHRSVTELRRELRQAKRAMQPASVAGEPTPPAAVAEPVPSATEAAPPPPAAEPAPKVEDGPEKQAAPRKRGRAKSTPSEG